MTGICPGLEGTNRPLWSCPDSLLLPLSPSHGPKNPISSQSLLQQGCRRVSLQLCLPCLLDGLQPYTVARWTLQTHLVALSSVLPLAPFSFAPGWALSMDPGPGSLLTVSELSPATSPLLCPQCSAPICRALSVLGSSSLLSDRVFLLLYSFMTWILTNDMKKNLIQRVSDPEIICTDIFYYQESVLASRSSDSFFQKIQPSLFLFLSEERVHTMGKENMEIEAKILRHFSITVNSLERTL